MSFRAGIRAIFIESGKRQLSEHFADLADILFVGQQETFGHYQYGWKTELPIVLFMHNEKAIKYYEEGRVLHGQGKLASAERAYNKAIKADRNFFEAYNNLGNVLVDRMRLREACGAYRKALKIRPDYPMLLNNLGNVLQLLGENKSAIQWLNKAIALDSNYADAHYNLGNAMRGMGNFDEAIQCFEVALKIDPQLVEAHVNLGILHMELNRLDEAIANLEKATLIDPGHAEAFYELGIALSRRGNAKAALAAYDKSIEIQPGQVKTHFGLGEVCMLLQQWDRARDSYARAINLKPDLASAYFGLAMVKKFKETDEIVAIMEKQCNNPRISTEESILFNFALGKVYGDLAIYDKAFACINRGNQLQWKSQQYDVNAEIAYFDQLKSAFPSGIFSNRITTEATEITPIFVVGLPRSGKTLCETLLASNSLIHAAGEREYFAEILSTVGDLKNPRGLVEQLLSLPANEIAGLAQKYLDQIQSSSGEELFVVDTLPVNFLYIGFIKLIFPDARIIHCFRDPMDACWFNYQKFFQGYLYTYTYDLATLATYCRGYLELMAHWHKVLPGCIHDLEYERLVTNMPQEIARLASFVGIDWNGVYLDTYENEPLHSNDIGAWRHYESHLRHLLGTLN